MMHGSVLKTSTSWWSTIFFRCKRYEQFAYLFLVLCAIYVLLNIAGYRIRKWTPRPKPYLRSVHYQCARHDGQHLDLIPDIRFKLYIISHDDRSQRIAERWSQCAPWTQVIRISSTPFFESYAYAEVFPKLYSEWKDLDFVGVATYKTLKMTSMEKLKAYLELAKYRPYDVVPLFGTGEELLPQAINGHGPIFQDVWYQTLQYLGYDANEVDKQKHIEIFLRNTYIAKPEWLQELIQFMNHAMDTYKKNPAFQALLSQDAKYREAKVEVARRVFHQDYYEWHPFIFERLPAFFFHYRNASIFTSVTEVKWFDNQETDTLFKGL